MRLVVAAIVRNEWDRYIRAWLHHVLTYADEVRILDDASTDNTRAWLRAQPQVRLIHNGPRFADNEGIAREALLEWALEGEPTHVLVLDADEFVALPGRVRALASTFFDQDVWTLPVREVWDMASDPWQVRVDGAWRLGRSPLLFRALSDRRYEIPHRRLACGREPLWVREAAAEGLARDMDVDLLHLGWANPDTRQARYESYMERDGGNHHARAHLESILAEPTLEPYPPPPTVVRALTEANR